MGQNTRNELSMTVSLRRQGRTVNRAGYLYGIIEFADQTAEIGEVRNSP